MRVRAALGALIVAFGSGCVATSDVRTPASSLPMTIRNQLAALNHTFTLCLEAVRSGSVVRRQRTQPQAVHPLGFSATNAFLQRAGTFLANFCQRFGALGFQNSLCHAVFLRLRQQPGGRQQQDREQQHRKIALGVFQHDDDNSLIFMARMVALAGSVAAAEALIATIATDPAAAAIVPPDDKRLITRTQDLVGGYKAYVAEPRTRSLKATVMVIHENRGLNDHIRDFARRLALANFREAHGGELTRIHVAHAQPLGNFDTWRQALPITLLDVVKPLDA